MPYRKPVRADTLSSYVFGVHPEPAEMYEKKYDGPLNKSHIGRGFTSVMDVKTELLPILIVRGRAARMDLKSIASWSNFHIH